jgi:ethanolamine utilization protein EutQ (cupin superfamily)
VFCLAGSQWRPRPDLNRRPTAGNLIDQRHGGPITIGYGRYGANQILDETLGVHDVMVVLEGRLSVSTKTATVTAGPGEIVYMPKGELVTT